MLAVPAFPDAGRETIGGKQRVQVASAGEDSPVAARLFGNSVVTTIDRQCIESGVDAVVETTRASSSRGIRYFVADSTDDRHLSTLAEAAATLEADDVDLVTVSPGAWLKYHPSRVIKRSRFVLVVISSATEQNHRQLDRLISTMPCLVLDPSLSTSGGVRLPAATDVTPRVVVLETITSHRGAEAGLRSLAEEAAKSAALVLDAAHRSGSQCVGLVVSGGFTAACLADELAADGIRAQAELEPLCGAGRLRGGGWDGLPLVTKGGLVGDDSTLSRLVTSLWDGRADG